MKKTPQQPMSLKGFIVYVIILLTMTSYISWHGDCIDKKERLEQARMETVAPRELYWAFITDKEARLIQRLSQTKHYRFRWEGEEPNADVTVVVPKCDVASFETDLGGAGLVSMPEERPVGLCGLCPF